MIVTVFRSRLRPGFQDEYVALVNRMQEIARTIPGYISHKGFWADDGERRVRIGGGLRPGVGRHEQAHGDGSAWWPSPDIEAGLAEGPSCLREA